LDTIYKNIYKYFDRFLSKKRRLQEKNYRDLCKIMEAIERRDSPKAQDLVQEHVRYFNRMMEERKQAAKRKAPNKTSNKEGMLCHVYSI
jgi:DNA-binding FadR family transcriptional regulator